MGLSIHYTGTFHPNASLPAFITEVKDIAETWKWSCNIFETEFPTTAHFITPNFDRNLYGLMIGPPKCEPLWLNFLSNGRMSGAVQLQFYADETDPERKEYLYSISVKTQYAGIEAHKLIIHLLRYLDKKYFQDFQLQDEGQYWETNDAAILKKNFDRYERLIEDFALGLEVLPMQENESFETYIQRIAGKVNERDKDNE